MDGFFTGKVSGNTNQLLGCKLTWDYSDGGACFQLGTCDCFMGRGDYGWSIEGLFGAC